MRCGGGRFLEREANGRGVDEGGGGAGVQVDGQGGVGGGSVVFVLKV